LLAPPWAPAATVLAVLVTALIAGLVWHSQQLPGLDAWVEERLGARTDHQFRLAEEVANGLRGLTVLGVVATAAAAWIVIRRWNAVALALLAPAGTLAAELLLKPLVARRAPDSTTFHYPSGHVAVATALAVSLVLLVRLAWARPAVRQATMVATGLLVVAMALSVLVATAHLFSDVVGGVATGVAVTLAAAWLLDGSFWGRLLQLQPDGLGQAAVQRGEREHGQRDHGRGHQEAVPGGDQHAEHDQADDGPEDPGHPHPARDRGPDAGWEQLGGDRAGRRGEHRGREDRQQVPGDRRRRRAAVGDDGRDRDRGLGRPGGHPPA
jgi:membrane-associated phospholipid phosphatase